jgi:glycerol kinase
MKVSMIRSLLVLCGYLRPKARRLSTLVWRKTAASAIIPGVAMNHQETIRQIRDLAHEIGTCVTRMHPLTGQLNDPPTRAEMLKALFELTKQVEVVKKHLLKLEKRDESTAL